MDKAHQSGWPKLWYAPDCKVEICPHGMRMLYSSKFLGHLNFGSVGRLLGLWKTCPCLKGVAGTVWKLFSMGCSIHSAILIPNSGFLCSGAPVRMKQIALYCTHLATCKRLHTRERANSSFTTPWIRECLNFALLETTILAANHKLGVFWCQSTHEVNETSNLSKWL